MRSLGTATPGIADQYADGKAAKVWQLYIGKYMAEMKVESTRESDMLGRCM